jgi:hypothetical protein
MQIAIKHVAFKARRLSEETDSFFTRPKRSAIVRDFVLARANGFCEACDEKAPFLKKNGTPYRNKVCKKLSEALFLSRGLCVLRYRSR